LPFLSLELKPVQLTLFKKLNNMPILFPQKMVEMDALEKLLKK
jgi:hypothetical protein